MSINEVKYENVILYLISQMQDMTIHGRKKLAKLLYYVDFDRFEYKESMETITGDEYRHLPMGPVPDMFRQVAQRMQSEGKLAIHEEHEYAGLRPTTLYRANVKPDMSVFDEDEKRILRRVARLYGPLTGKELENKSHAEAPWLGIEEGEHIPFELAFYRETDFSDAK